MLESLHAIFSVGEISNYHKSALKIIIGIYLNKQIVLNPIQSTESRVAFVYSQNVPHEKQIPLFTCTGSEL